uniref:SFRICE_021002 n=1 Tax=Spodoptera frugiperda TaxID=7108 RepID=A0A2H1WB39_SPOFR
MSSPTMGEVKPFLPVLSGLEPRSEPHLWWSEGSLRVWFYWAARYPCSPSANPHLRWPVNVSRSPTPIFCRSVIRYEIEHGILGNEKENAFWGLGI